METKEALTRFLKKCEERGLSPKSRTNYWTYLRHFADEHPDLPTDTKIIEAFLKKRKETPGRRGHVFKCIQAFYSYLEEFEGIKSPVPPRGPMGRPRKVKVVNNPGMSQILEIPPLPGEKSSLGGLSVSTSTSISTADAVESFIRSRRVKGATERTLENYRWQFKPFLRKFPLLPLTAEPIEELLDSIQGDIETRWTYRRTIVALYHFLEQRKKIPTGLVTIPSIKRPKKVRRTLSAEELAQLFPFCVTFQEKAMLALLIDAKIRAGELVTLTRERVHPDHITVTGKTGERDVPIKPETFDMLVQLAPSGLLFTLDGRPMRREYCRKIVHRIMLRSGLEGKKLSPHILRHSASVQHMMFGGDLMSLKEELGHDQVSTTQIYAELAAKQVKQRHQEVDVLGKIMNGQPLHRTPLERAQCYGCKVWVMLELDKIKEAKCPSCKQVGKWYLPNHGGGVQPSEGAAK